MKDKVFQDSRKETDYDLELTGGVEFFLIIFLAALDMGFIAAALGAVIFLMS